MAGLEDLYREIVLDHYKSPRNRGELDAPPAVRAHEKQLTAYTLRALEDRFEGRLHLYGPRDIEVRGGAVSFLFDGIHAHDISQVLDEDAVCVRAGHHCAKPLMRALGVPAAARASWYVYNDCSDVDALVEAIGSADEVFGF